MDFTKETKIINHIKEEKDEYLEEVFKQKYFPKDILNRIKNVNNSISKKMDEFIGRDDVDYKEMSNFINILIKEKVYFNDIIISTNYIKGKFDVIRSNTKLKTIKEQFDDGEIKNKNLMGDIVNIDLDNLNAFYNLIKDIIEKIKVTKDNIDTTLMGLQSQLKNITFDYLNANK